MALSNDPVDNPVQADDLSALSWVQEELRRSLELANKALRRYLKEQSQAADLDTVDPAVLRQARSQLHQSVGVLELVGLGRPAELLRAAEAALLRLSARPKLITPAAADTIEHGSFALLDFIARRLAGNPVSTLALFPQYRALQELAGITRAHPADLWTVEWSWRLLPEDSSAAPRQPDDETVGRIEADLLALMRGAPPSVAARMSELFAGLARSRGTSPEASVGMGATPVAQTAARRRLTTLWQLAAGFFEAQADGLLKPDAYSKRVGSKLLAQLRAGDHAEPSERLAHDLLFFCGQATPQVDRPVGPRLAAVRRAYDLSGAPAVDYDQPRLGRFDPAWVAQARKRVAAAKEVWSAVAGGDLARLGGLSEQFALVSDSLARLYPDGGVLGRSLQVAAAHTAATSAEPPAELAMEVATALLYIDASLDDGDFDHTDGAQRIHRLAQRIDSVRQARDPGTLELWMEELYRRVSDRQTMGSVVQELRASLSEVEKNIDLYFRDPARRELLIPVPAQLSAMRGVLSVLGLDQASQAVLRMRDDVDALANTEVNPQRAIETGTFDRLADNLGALSFLIDMVSVQPQMAKSLFRFDPETGSLAAVMAREDRPTGFDALELPSDDDQRGLPDTDAMAVTLEFDRIVKQARATQRGMGGPNLAAERSTARPAGLGLPVNPQALLGSHGLPMLDMDTPARSAESQTPASGSATAATAQATAQAIALPAAPMPESKPAPAAPPAVWVSGLEDDPEMREVFLDEAREVLAGARQSLVELQARHDDRPALNTVRRAFHTLKGSARMIGLGSFGDAAWSCEQLYNACLAEPGAAADHDLREFSGDACGYFERWVQALVAGDASAFHADPLVQAAELLRTGQRYVPLLGTVPAGAALETLPVEALALDPVALEPAAIEAKVAGAAVENNPTEDGAGAAAEPVPGLTPDFAPEPSGFAELQFDDVPALPEPANAARRGLLDRVPDLPLAADLDFELLPALALAADAATAPAASADSAPEVVWVAEPDLPELDLAALDDADAAPPAMSAAVPAPMIEVAEAIELDLDLDFGATFGDQVDALTPDLLLDLPALAAPVVELRSGLMQDPVPDLVLDLALDADLPAPVPAAVIPPELPSVPMAPAEPLIAVRTEAELEVEAESDTPATADAEAYRQIGSLRIGIPLFNIYLNEADELSRRLGIELAEWALEQHRPVGDAAVALAHSLAGSSGTVGYTELSQLARELEHALERSNLRGHGRGEEAQHFNQAAEEIRRLLHLFAAGFLHSPDADLLQALQVLAHSAPDVAEPGIEPGIEPTVEPARDRVSDTAPGAPVPALSAAPVMAVPHEVAAGILGRAALLPFEALQQPAQLPRQRGFATGFDEDIDQVDAIDAELFPFFVEEAHDLLPQLQSRLRDWARRPSEREAAAACMRSLHTFKGGSRLAGAMRLGELAHRLESAVEVLSAEGAALTSPAVETLVGFADALQAAFDALCLPPPVPVATPVVTPVAPVAMPRFAATPAAGLPASTAAAVSLTPLVAAPATLSKPAAAQPARVASPVSAIDWQRFAALPAADEQQPVRAAGAAGTGSVRVRAPLLDRLVNQAGEVSITRARIESDVGQIKGSLGDLSDNLDRLRAQLRDIELQAETQIGTRMEAARAAAQQFDPLEMDRFTRFQELTRMMAESVADVATVQRGLQRTLQSTEDALAHQARMTRGMQDDLLRTRMVEFEGLSERLYRVVRMAAKETGKSVRLDIVGGGVEIDRGVLDRMTPAFEHLLRNSVVHGIEAPALRSAAGKDSTGTISLVVSQVGNEVAVEVRDDGAGLDLPRILERARVMGLVARDAQPDDAELANLIFQPGVSTAASITDLAGRGVGMDVVRTDVNAMGGRIETASAPGQGSSFRLVLPLTTAVTQVVMLRCGAHTVAVPSTLVEIVRRVPLPELAQAYAQAQFADSAQPGQAALPFFWLDALLNGTPRGLATGRTAPVVIIRSAAQRVVLHVDEVLGNQEVVVKNLGPQLSKVPGLVGLTLLPSGLPALIYNPVALATLHGETARATTAQALSLVAPVGSTGLPGSASLAAPLAPLVLVVDDSLTVRRITQRLLEREGYRVMVAKDGLDGLEKLSAERPTLLLTDIEMPRMDGFDLVRNLRADRKLADLPVIMITSRLAQKHRDYAAELGVDHYLGKPYGEDELLGLVARYARRTAMT